jgi:hypothetical protein
MGDKEFTASVQAYVQTDERTFAQKSFSKKFSGASTLIDVLGWASSIECIPQCESRDLSDVFFSKSYED